MKKMSQFLAISSIVLCLGSFGCGSGGDRPELGLVSGTVFHKGKPLSGASVTFLPDEGRPATAITDPNGKYDLKYIRNTRGCKPGHNKVMITSLVEGRDDSIAEGDDVVQTKPKPNKEALPPKYNSKTELEKDVQPGKNTFDFHLE